MKNILRLSALILFTSLIICGCKKDETKVLYEGGTEPELTSSVSADTVSYVNAGKTVLTLNWSNPDYSFNTGVSSLDVTYQLEVDTVGSNFTNPKMKIINVSKDLSYSFTAAALNDIMLNQLNLQENMQHSLEFRVVAYIVTKATSLSSNSVQYAATPYSIPPKVTPPASGVLYIVGDATPGGWPPLSNDPSVEKFTTLSPTHFQLSIPINGDKEYKFVEVPGEWTYQWSIKTEQASSDPSTFSYDLYYNGANGRAPSSSGNYLIDVNFQTGKVSFTKQ